MWLSKVRILCTYYKGNICMEKGYLASVSQSGFLQRFVVVTVADWSHPPPPPPPQQCLHSSGTNIMVTVIISIRGTIHWPPVQDRSSLFALFIPIFSTILTDQAKGWYTWAKYQLVHQKPSDIWPVCTAACLTDFSQTSGFCRMGMLENQQPTGI